MKKKIQPKYYDNAKVTCSTCGNTFTVGSTIPEIKVDTCSNCHQFYTGTQTQTQATGRVEKFQKKFAAGETAKKKMVKINKEKLARQEEQKKNKDTKKRDK